MWLRSASLAALAVSFTACALDDIDVDEPNTSTAIAAVAGGGDGCPGWTCTVNDPQLQTSLGLPVKFHELNKKGAPNKEGVTLVGIEVGTTMYQVDVVGAKIYAKRVGFPTVSGSALRGSYIHVKYAGVEFKLRIDDVLSTLYYPNDGTRTETYRISYKEVGTPDGGGVWPNLCSIADTLPSEPSDPPGPILLGMNKWTLVVHEGERFDAKTKSILPTIDTNWFTIGCASHVLAKLHILRHTWISQGGAYPNSPAQRQAMLKMFSADYFGDGTSFTFHDEPLVWQDSPGWFSFALPPVSLEARWTYRGADCLQEPRLKITTNPLDAAYFPNGIEDAIARHGTRPYTCSMKYKNVDPTLFFGDDFVSANP